jgi:hypothetical protein
MQGITSCRINAARDEMIEKFNIALNRNGIQHLAGISTNRPSRVVIVMSPGLEYHDISSSVEIHPLIEQPIQFLSTMGKTSSTISVNNYDNISGHMMY